MPRGKTKQVGFVSRTVVPCVQRICFRLTSRLSEDCRRRLEMVGLEPGGVGGE